MALAGGSFRADVLPDVIDGTPLLRAYGDTYFQIGNTQHETGISIHQGAVTQPWGTNKVSQLTLEDFQHILEQPPEVLLIGTGRTTCFPDEGILSTLSEKHIGFECMDSRAAARTYNILIAEGRTVSCLLLLPNTRK